MKTIAPALCSAIAHRLAAERRLAADPAHFAPIVAAQPAVAARLAYADTLLSAASRGILVGDLAKLLVQAGIVTGQKRLFAWMRAHGFLLRTRTAVRNIPSQRAMELGLFAVQERAVKKPDGTTFLTQTPRVTPKGQMYFLRLLKNEKETTK